MEFDARTDRLSESFAEASLADHFDLQLKLRRRERRGTSEAFAFLAADDADVMSLASCHPPYDTPLIHQAIRACFSDWKLVGEGGQQGRYDESRVPRFSRYEIAPGVFHSYLEGGSLLYQLPNGKRRVISISPASPRDPRVDLLLLGRREDALSLRHDHRKLVRWMRRHHYLKRQAIRPDGSLLRGTGQVSPADLVLDDSVRQTLLHNTVDFLKMRSAFRANGIPQKRGVLLYGPPGNGKTMIAKLLAGLGVTTFLYVTAADANEPEKLQQVFHLARRLRPTIVFLEDLDFYASDRRGPHRVSLGELLAQLDGLEQNDGLIVIATTNDLAAIEPALKDRPSRFDVVLEVGPPSETCRRKMLVQLLRRTSCDSLMIATAASLTKGLSGAQVREVAVLAIQSAICSGTVDGDGVATLSPNDLITASNFVRWIEKRPIGFQCSGE